VIYTPLLLGMNSFQIIVTNKHENTYQVETKNLLIFLNSDIFLHKSRDFKRCKLQN
jgi:hypothetical protein